MKHDSLKVKKGASVARDAVVAGRELAAAIRQPDAKLSLFYCSSEYDLDVLGRVLSDELPGTELLGASSAGEITPAGYLDGAITGVSIGSESFSVVTQRLDDLASFAFADGEAAAEAALQQLQQRGLDPSGANSFAFLLIDGLSTREEAVVSSVYRNLGDIQLFGGSAGDGTRFGETHVFHEGKFRKNCAVLSVMHTENPFRVFKTQHFVSSDDKMVVTEADPDRRIVTEINGEPAGREYARLVGLDVAHLTPMIFSAYPVVVKLGGGYYVRSIQKVNDDESLTFFCAIDEGIVLTVARGVDLIENLEGAFGEIRREIGEPELVLGCDCILRSLECDQRGVKERVGDLMVENNVIGFATYGEQFNAMHVNQTFTGVAIGTRE
ncbi:MAG: FIST C-terminal domain-containing protein [Polyangiaceae bacterium]|nr:FIST C-terminal domain-containing protein [Polyangiaceae bacterium]